MQSREEYDKINKKISDLKKEIKEGRHAIKMVERRAKELADKRARANAFMPWSETYELEKLEEQLSEANRMKESFKNISDPTIKDKETRLLELRAKKVKREEMYSPKEDEYLCNYEEFVRETEAKERQLRDLESRQKMIDRSDITQFFDIKGPLDMVPVGMETQVIDGQEMHIPCYRPKTPSELIRDKRKCLSELMKKEEAGEITSEVAELVEDKLADVYESIRKEREDKKADKESR